MNRSVRMIATIGTVCLVGCKPPQPEPVPPVIQFRATATPLPQETTFREVQSTPVPTLPVPPTPLPDGDRAVARVGGVPIMLSDVLGISAEREQQLAVRPGDAIESARNELRRHILDKLIENRLKEWEAAHGAVELSPEEQDAELARWIDGHGGYEQVLARARRWNLSEDEMRNVLLEQIRIARLHERNVTARIDLSEQAMRDYYEANRTRRFRVPGCVYLRRVVIEEKEGRTREQARQLAEQLHAQAVAALEAIDASYAVRLEHESDARKVRDLLRDKQTEKLHVIRDMAVAHSDGPDRQQGGNVALYDVLLDGSEREMQFDPAFVQHVYEHGRAGELSPLVETAKGFVFYFEDRRLPAKQKSYDDSKAFIRQILLREQQDKLYKQWIERLTERAGVETYPEHLTFYDEEMVRSYVDGQAEPDLFFLHRRPSPPTAPEQP